MEKREHRGQEVQMNQHKPGQIKIERETQDINRAKAIKFDGLMEIDTRDVSVDSIVIDPEQKKVLINYRE